MSKTLSFRGQLPIGIEETIKLRTLNGKTAYKITKFQLMSSEPGAAGKDVEFIGQIYKTENTTNINTTPNFSNGDLIAVVYYQDDPADHYNDSSLIIFDNEVFNQDIYINVSDAAGGTVPANYYIELEAMEISDIQATQLTLQSLRNVANV